ncbi:hypothetical protein Q4575_15355 [Psychrosphaera sp. 1_MG-2023]|uniref:hypothetical protein n=1 Tax=Psychrosphaera sp. 1_MG-2023 TaxID=3062643 RepID=UPI0026E488EE|nr:hypothetical protein [Psychrosphaera sp. 1_MG-2023]MDO6720790.1 hypothetical protein [Psychrosphaera sp. 1_MG-2023]
MEELELLVVHDRLEEILLAEKHVLDNKLLSDPLDVYREMHPSLRDIWYSPGIEFKCLLDRNVVSYLVSLANGLDISKQKNQDPYRSVAALQTVLNAGKILSETGYAYHEYMERNSLTKADDELALFRAADNLDPNIYLDLFLKQRDCINSNELLSFNTGELVKGDLPERLTLVERNAVIVKKAISIARTKDISPYQTMLELMDWVYDEYMFSMPSFQFLSVYFSSWKVSKMIKSHGYQDLRNATWDISFVQQLIKCCREDNESIWLFSSFDKAIHTVVDLTFVKREEDESLYMERIEKAYASMWGKKNGYGKKLLKKMLKISENSNDPERKINLFNGSAEYQLDLRARVHKEYEEALS